MHVGIAFVAASAAKLARRERASYALSSMGAPGVHARGSRSTIEEDDLSPRSTRHLLPRLPETFPASAIETIPHKRIWMPKRLKHW